MTTAVGPETRLAADDVHEFFAAQVGAEPCLGHHVIRQFQRTTRSNDRVGAVSDVGKGAAVDKSGRVFNGLNQVGPDRVLEQSRHGTVDIEVADIDGFFVEGIGAQDVSQPPLEIRQVGRQTEDRHDLRGHGDLETALPRDAVNRAAQTDDDVAQGAIVHIQDTLPDNAPRIDIEGIALMDVVVDHSGQKVVGLPDGVNITGEMEIDVLHGQYLRIAAAGCAALEAETRAH